MLLLFFLVSPSDNVHVHVQFGAWVVCYSKQFANRYKAFHYNILVDKECDNDQ